MNVDVYRLKNVMVPPFSLNCTSTKMDRNTSSGLKKRKKNLCMSAALLDVELIGPYVAREKRRRKALNGACRASSDFLLFFVFEKNSIAKQSATTTAPRKAKSYTDFALSICMGRSM